LNSDIADAVITLSDRPTELSGAVRDSVGNPTSAGVLWFPVDPKEWSNFSVVLTTRIGRTRSNPDGSFIVSLAPGDYLIVAVPESAMENWARREFIESVSRFATRISVAAATKTSTNLSVVTGVRR
jgi:hypothetical protein